MLSQEYYKELGLVCGSYMWRCSMCQVFLSPTEWTSVKINFILIYLTDELPWKLVRNNCLKVIFTVLFLWIYAWGLSRQSFPGWHVTVEKCTGVCRYVETVDFTCRKVNQPLTVCYTEPPYSWAPGYSMVPYETTCPELVVLSLVYLNCCLSLVFLFGKLMPIAMLKLLVAYSQIQTC